MNIYIRNKYQKLACYDYGKPKSTLLIQIFALYNKLLQLLNTTFKMTTTVINTAFYLLLALSCGSQGAKKKKSLAAVKAVEKGHPIQTHKNSV